MHIIARKTLEHFWTRHPDAAGALQAWYYEAKSATWRSSAEVKARYRSASIVSSERVVFNICGNRYRLVTRIRYASGTVFICFLGTHSEYGRIDAERV